MRTSFRVFLYCGLFLSQNHLAISAPPSPDEWKPEQSILFERKLIDSALEEKAHIQTNPPNEELRLLHTKNITEEKNLIHNQGLGLQSDLPTLSTTYDIWVNLFTPLARDTALTVLFRPASPSTVSSQSALIRVSECKVENQTATNRGERRALIQNGETLQSVTASIRTIQSNSNGFRHFVYNTTLKQSNSEIYRATCQANVLATFTQWLQIPASGASEIPVNSALNLSFVSALGRAIGGMRIVPTH